MTGAPRAALVEVRRLTGPNVLLDGAGAVADVVFGAEPGDAVVEAWRAAARRILDAVGWGGEATAVRRVPGGASLAISAPIDALYAACDVGAWAWEAALGAVRGAPPADVAAAAARLRAAIAAEADPALVALRDAAAAHGVAFLWDADAATVGLGTGSRTWPVDGLPAPGAVDWAAIHDVPVALVTGTNGKSTTVRLVAAMIAAAGRVPGLSTTDWVRVGGETLDRGDYSGPGGARMALRDRRVEAAVLETARGGLMRRGLAVDRADVAAVTNLAEDHLGDFGLADLAALADVKLVVARVARGCVLNADDPVLRARGAGLGRPVTWFSLRPEDPWLAERAAAGAGVCVCGADGRLTLRPAGGARGDVLDVAAAADVPITLGGAARYNVANALAAIAVADALGVPPAAIRAGLVGFESTPDSNPGRLNLFDVGGVRVLVDYAHNPHGVRALNDVIRGLGGRRRLVAIDQAGDRDDAALADLARATLEGRPDAVIVKELRSHLRGRPEGEVPRVLAAALAAQGFPAASIAFAGDELEALDLALAWAEPGDLVVLMVHAQRQAVIDRLAAGGSAPSSHRPPPMA